MEEGGPPSNIPNVLIKGMPCDRDHTQGEHYVNMKAEISHTSTSQEMPKMASKPSEVKRNMNRFSLTALKRNKPCPHLELRLPASRTVWEIRWVMNSSHTEVRPFILHSKAKLISLGYCTTEVGQGGDKVKN